jgi:hypothetical protein
MPPRTLCRLKHIYHLVSRPSDYKLQLTITSPPSHPPADNSFSAAVWASQIGTTSIYVFNGLFVYMTTGNATWLESPANMSLKPGIPKDVTQAIVIIYFSLAVLVDGTTFIRNVQTYFQPLLVSIFCCLCPPARSHIKAQINAVDPKAVTPAENESPTSVRACKDTAAKNRRPCNCRAGESDDLDSSRRTADENAVYRMPHDATEEMKGSACSCAPQPSPARRPRNVADLNDWSIMATAWWFLWCALTMSFVAFVAIGVGNFDVIMAITAALVASQTSISWPSFCHYWLFCKTSRKECYHHGTGTSPCKCKSMRGTCIADLSVVLLGVALLVTGIWAYGTAYIVLKFKTSQPSHVACTRPLFIPKSIADIMGLSARESAVVVLSSGKSVANRGVRRRLLAALV